jgi:taurine dioxygenase
MAEAATTLTEREFRFLDVQPIAGSLGAEVLGVDLGTINDDAFDEINRALLDHQVIFFRDQSLDLDQYLAFAKRWGKIAIYPYMKGLPTHPEILEILKTEKDTYAFGNIWHTDSSFLAIPPKVTMLYGLEIPPAGGDTAFTNLYMAYETLSDGLKAMLNGLKAMNVGDQPLARFSEIADMKAKDPGKVQVKTLHPVVRTHPDTGRKALYVGGHTVYFEDMTKEESAPLLNYLKNHATKPEFTCRFRWRPGSIALWDNRCTLHYAIDDYAGHRRRMHRIIVEAEQAPF